MSCSEEAFTYIIHVHEREAYYYLKYITPCLVILGQQTPVWTISFELAI